MLTKNKPMHWRPKFMGHSKCMAAILIAASFFALSACARPAGDFGRPDKKFHIIHDWLMPFGGRLKTSAQEQKRLSLLNYTAEDIQLRHASYSLVLPAHHDDWMGASKAELERTRILKLFKLKSLKTSYHASLRHPKHGSSNARWNLLSDHILADMQLVAAFQSAALTSIEQDRLRLQSKRAHQANSDWDERHVLGRVKENDEIITWAMMSAWQRYEAFSYSLDRLSIEEPLLDPQTQHSARAALSQLKNTISATEKSLTPVSNTSSIYK